MNTKILVVDDEQDFVDLISYNLKEHGFTVLASNDGLDAIVKARRYLPDLVILDLMLDGMDGYSVCEILRHQPSTKGIPIIMITAATGQIARLNGLTAGADDFLRKPFSPHELMQGVERVQALQTAKLEREQIEP